MQDLIYPLSQIIIIILVIGLISSLLYGLRYALVQFRMPTEKRKYLLGLVGTSILLWLTILSVLSFSGFFQNFESLPPGIFIAISLPLLLIFVLLFSKSFGLILKVIPESWLIYIQAFRIIMELLLWLGYNGGFVPPQMTLVWLNHDIIVGITALMAGYVFFGQGRYRRSEAIIWNVFGMSLLFNILIISILSAPFPFRVFFNEPANTFVANFPFIWIPGFIVPFALAMHLFSLKQLILFPKKRREFTLRK